MMTRYVARARCEAAKETRKKSPEERRKDKLDDVDCKGSTSRSIAFPSDEAYAHLGRS